MLRFVDGNKFPSKLHVRLSRVLPRKQLFIKADRLTCNIPLLLSKQSMKNAGMVMYLKDDPAIIFGKKIELHSTTMGHCTLPICLPIDEKRVNATFIGIGSQNKKEVEKLYKQFAHHPAEKLKKFLRTAGMCEPTLFEQFDKVTDRCDSCIKYKKKETSIRYPCQWGLSSTKLSP